MRLFLDSSALAKRYVEEPGSLRVAELCGGAEEIVLSVLCVPELVSGFNRLRREGRLTTKPYRRLKRALAADIAEASIVDVTPAVVERAIRCLERAPLRCLDALHIASAIESGCGLFLTADIRQAEAARRLRLPVEIAGGAH